MPGTTRGATFGWRVLLLGVLALAGTVVLVGQEPSSPPKIMPRLIDVGVVFNGKDLSGWKVENTNADVDVIDGILHVGSGNGWVRTERAYSDFVMTMEVRLDDKAEAGIFLRAWPTFDQSSRPTNGYRLQFTGVKPGADGWARIEVDCTGRTLTVRVNGAVVQTADVLENPQGHVALWATEKTAQFRAIEIRQRPVRMPAVPPGVAGTGAVGIVVPRPLFSPKPKYTPDAMRARISGGVTMAATVLPDGAVSDVLVLRSLDPKFGLDQAAIETAQAWRFAPGTRAGEPVPVRIMIEFEFNLR
jgi:TonB family protein